MVKLSPLAILPALLSSLVLARPIDEKIVAAGSEAIEGPAKTGSSSTPPYPRANSSLEIDSGLGRISEGLEFPTAEQQQPPRAGIWQPAVGVKWQIILSRGDEKGPSKGADSHVRSMLASDAQIFDLDLFENSAETIRALKAGGKRVICYFSAGSSENWRPDFNKFPKAVIGNKMDGWAGENWLDIRSAETFVCVFIS
jgi:hypothetical protein